MAESSRKVLAFEAEALNGYDGVAKIEFALVADDGLDATNPRQSVRSASGVVFRRDRCADLVLAGLTVRRR